MPFSNVFLFLLPRQALKYVGSPETLLAQLEYYAEDKFKDNQEMHDRMRILMMQSRDEQEHLPYESQDINEELMLLAKQHGELHELVIEMIRHCVQLLKRSISM